MIKEKRGVAVIIALFVGLALFSGCSNKVNTWASRQYHAATTRWNVYFNGKESLKKGQELIRKNHVEDFDKILPLYYENNITARNVAEKEMERAVSKAVKAIELHSITAKPKRRKGKRESEKYKAFRRKKEYNNLIDECYLLLGKAQFYRREYYSTERTLRYILREYPQTPVYYEASIYYARTLAEQDKFFRALRTVEDVMQEPNFPENLKNTAIAAKADMYMRRGMLAEAVTELEYLTRNTKKSEGQTRYYYLLAQLHTVQGDIARAQAAYTDLIATHPEYDYAFHAKLSHALLYDKYGLNEGQEKVISELKKMLKDGRNKKYLDQVYYTIGKVYEQQEAYERALENYLLAEKYGTNNAKQQVKTLLALGDLNFEKNKDYATALENYTKVSGLITEEYPQYDEITVRLESLKQLAENLRTVQLQDSLIRIARMPQMERNEFIKQLMLRDRKNIDKKNRREKKKLESALKIIDRPVGDWYFYNPLAIERGQEEFKKKWGEIMLTDNWRKTPRQQTSSLLAQSKDHLIAKKHAFRTFEEYMEAVPTTPEQMQKSRQQTIDALYNAGVIYEDEVEDFSKAIVAFEKVLERKPKDEEKTLRANYHLFLLNSLLGNDEKAVHYKNVVLNQYPESKLAKVLQDPAYYTKLRQRGIDAEQLYQKAYAAYRNYDFNKANALSQSGLSEYKNTSLHQRFAFLNAMAKAYTDTAEAFRKALEYAKKVASDEQILATATALLEQLDKGIVPNKNTKRPARQWTVADFENAVEIRTDSLVVEETIEIPDYYSVKEREKQYYALVLPRDIEGNIEQEIAAFNEKYFFKENLHVRRRGFTTNSDIILVESFAGKAAALKYYAQFLVQAQRKILKNVNEVDYNSFLITERNLRKLTADRTLSPYLEYYAVHYLGEGAEEKEEMAEKPKTKNPKDVKVEDLQAAVSFSEAPDAQHHFVLIIPRKGSDINYFWTALHRYDERFRVKKERLGNRRMLVVENVGNRQQALDYLKSIVKTDYIYNNLQNVEYRNFVITTENLKTLRSTQAVANYIQFFKDKYLK